MEYNSVRLHAAIGYVTPSDEHDGEGDAVRQAVATASSGPTKLGEPPDDPQPTHRPETLMMRSECPGICPAKSETPQRGPVKRALRAAGSTVRYGRLLPNGLACACDGWDYRSGVEKKMFRRRTDPDQLAGRLMQWAWQTAGAINWSHWRLHPGDRLIAYGAPPFGVPPLTEWLVLDYARLHGWLVGRPLAEIDFSLLEPHLAERWRTAASYANFGLVQDVVADVLLWTRIVGMPEELRQAVRQPILSRHSKHATAPPAGPVFSAPEPWPGRGAPAPRPDLTPEPAPAPPSAEPREPVPAAASAPRSQPDSSAQSMMSSSFEASLRDQIGRDMLKSALSPLGRGY
jgi:hypothetical protein